MKWIKHMTCASRNEKLARLIDLHGVEGYGFYWLVLETIGEQTDESGQVSVKSSPRFWRNITNFSAKKFRKLAESCATLGLFSVNFYENEIEIGCPNLLKYCDEWTKKKVRNSGVAPEKLRNPLEVEVEVEENKKKPPLSPAEKGACKNKKSGSKYSESFECFWQAYPRKKAKASAWRAWEKARKEKRLPELDEIVAAIQAQIQSSDWRKEAGQFIPYPATWLNADRWADDTGAPAVTPEPSMPMWPVN
jgi:hypothetical protein